MPSVRLTRQPAPPFWRRNIMAVGFSVMVHALALAAVMVAAGEPFNQPSLTGKESSSAIWVTLSAPPTKSIQGPSSPKKAVSIDETVDLSQNSMAVVKTGPLLSTEGHKQDAQDDGFEVAAASLADQRPEGTTVSRHSTMQAGLNYQAILLEHIRPHRRYPAVVGSAPRGMSKVGITISRTGKIQRVWLVDTSGYRLLDQAAINTIWAADPLPPVPLELPDRVDAVLPVDFS